MLKLRDGTYSLEQAFDLFDNGKNFITKTSDDAIEHVVELMRANGITDGLVLVAESQDTSIIELEVVDIELGDIVTIFKEPNLKFYVIEVEVPLQVPICSCKSKEPYNMTVELQSEKDVVMAAECSNCGKKYGLIYNLAKVVELPKD